MKRRSTARRHAYSRRRHQIATVIPPERCPLCSVPLAEHSKAGCLAPETALEQRAADGDR